MKGLTAGERDVIRKLGEAWALFMGQPRCFPDEIEEFKTALHSAQTLVMARAAVRDFPESFNHVEGFK